MPELGRLPQNAYSSYRVNRKRLLRADLDSALAAHPDVRIVVLSPVNSGLTVPANVRVEISGGVSACECWLAPGPIPIYRRSGLLSQLVEGESFFCQVCLVDKPIAEQSTNKKYCQPCQEFLKAERLAVANTRGDKEDIASALQPESFSGGTLEGVDNLSQGTVASTMGKGRYSGGASVDVITQLSREGLSSREIAKKLAADGIKVSQSTVARVVRKVKAPAAHQVMLI